MYREWNILKLELMLKDDRYTPLKKYFIWEKLKELKVEYGSFRKSKFV